MAEHRADSVVPGVFGSREQAAAAINDLRALGLSDEDIGIAVPDPGRYELVDHSTREAFEGVVKGIAIGATVGTVAGIGLVGVLLPGFGLLGAGGLLIGIRDGLIWGSFLGASGGLAAKVRWDDAEDRWCEIPLGGGDILVVARAGSRAKKAREIMEGHGAKCFMDEARRDETAAGSATAPPAERRLPSV